MTEPGPVAQALGYLAYNFSLVQPLIPTYTTLIAAAVLPIFAGAHASLSRPSSATKPKTRKGRRDGSQESSGQKMEGLSPSDAILYPIMTGCMLTGLYFLIKWLKDPEILNKIINWYLSSFGIFSVAKLVSDLMSVTRSFVFPDRFSDGGQVWKIEPSSGTATVVQIETGSVPKMQIRKSPLPGILSRLPLAPPVSSTLWRLRAVLTDVWVVLEVFAYDLFDANIDIGLNGALGLIISISSLLYFNLVSKPWWLTNLFGFSFSYSALQLMSPTTFWTGTLVLTSLFFYDIYFVFFTPLMVTVATKLDIPVKLLIPKPSDEDPSKLSFAMLGLGDIVLPGIMIGLALRFDLYLFYLKKQKKKEIDASNDKSSLTGLKEASGSTAKTIELDSTNKLQLPLTYDSKGLGKMEYVTATGGWGERFWLGNSEAIRQEGGKFPKTYFYTGVTGYILGMITTVCVMHFAQHAQPALLYLVPSVLISLWGTALVRGEIQTMWNYTEEDPSEKKEKTEDKSRKADGKENESVDEAEVKKVSNDGSSQQRVKEGKGPSAETEIPQNEGGRGETNSALAKSMPKKSEGASEDDTKGEGHISSTRRSDRKGRYFFFAVSEPRRSKVETTKIELAPELVTGLKSVSRGPVGQEPDAAGEEPLKGEDTEPPGKRAKLA
ncbi:MAG: hypothetical protein LQ340_002114 [Diploschistes diacapsis]|nr:MAG: hypothetical protein LQ340_002114 [Diploschistes diacapsis]